MGIKSVTVKTNLSTRQVDSIEIRTTDDVATISHMDGFLDPGKDIAPLGKGR